LFTDDEARRIAANKAAGVVARVAAVISLAALGPVSSLPVKTDTPKSVRVNVTLRDDILEQIDRYAAAHGMTRSGFLAAAAKRELETA
jgi:hypothetical protein